MITACKQVSVARPGAWAKLRCTQPRQRGRHAAHMSLHASLHHPARTPADLLQKCPWHAVSTASPGVPPSDLVFPGRYRARTPAARHVLKDERAEADHMSGQRCRLSCVETGPAARSCGPTHACEGAGRRQRTARSPADGWRTCGMSLGPGIRPALSLFWTPPCGEGPPPAGRRSGPHGRIRTLPGAKDIYRSRSARLCRGLRP